MLFHGRPTEGTEVLHCNMHELNEDLNLFQNVSFSIYDTDVVSNTIEDSKILVNSHIMYAIGKFYLCILMSIRMPVLSSQLIERKIRQQKMLRLMSIGALTNVIGNISPFTPAN